jgi:hypothetical protein
MENTDKKVDNEEIQRLFAKEINQIEEAVENLIVEQQQPPFEYKPTRSCGDCTACCEGWLTADIHGKQMYSGAPCHYKGERGCTIYEHRPQLCVNFKCAWLGDPDVPEWMKPSLSKVIMYWREINDIPYMSIVECGQPINSSALNWIVQKALQNGLSVRYQVNGGWNMISSNPDFFTAFD